MALFTSTVSPARPAPQTELLQASRSLLVDVVRGMAIILVAFGHTNQGLLHRNWWGASPLGGEIDAFVYAFHMPAFFFVSGIFLKASIAKRGAPRFLRERFFTLMWPYVLWSCVNAIALIPLARFASQGTHSPQEFLIYLLTGRISWFLPSIFFALLLATVAVGVSPAITLPVSVALAALPLHTPLVFVSSGLHYLPFLLLGMAVGPRIARLDRVPLAVSLLFAVLFGVVVGAATHRALQHSLLGYLLTGLLGTAMLFLVARCVQGMRGAGWLAWTGSASLAIFLLSEFPQGGGRVLVQTMLHTTRPLLQDTIPTLFAVVLPAWLYHRRHALRIAWMFESPFATAPSAKKIGAKT